MENNEIRICLQCGIDISSKISSAKYCSGVCRDKHKWQKQKSSRPAVFCRQCKKEITGKPKNAKYCSSECREDYWHTMLKNKNRDSPETAKNCKLCGKEILGRNTKAKYCSRKCKHAATNEKLKTKRKEKIESRPKNFCLYCGGQILKRRADAIYCSKQCREFDRKIKKADSLALYHKQYRITHKKSKPKSKIKKYCLHCEKRIVGRNIRAKYCSELCLSLYYIKKRSDKVKGEKEKNRRFCLHCKNEITYMNAKAKYCSTICGASYRQKKFPEKLREKDRRRRSLVLKVNEYFTAADEAFTFTLFNNKCFNCGKDKDLCVDHVKPLSKGNALTRKNACILCKSCNSSKSDKNPEDFYTKEKFSELMNILNSIEEPIIDISILELSTIKIQPQEVN